jgi:ribosomal protein S18 acetylase RimI-like enzyme
MNELAIRPLRDTAEARFCAAFMAGSEPWLTLGLTEDQVFQRLTDSSRQIQIAELKNQVVGALILFLDGPLNGYIQTIAVHPDWRNRGIGQQIMRLAEAIIFKQSPNVFLCVSSFNHGAQKFYERLGYERVGELPNFLRHGFGEIILRKTQGPLLTFHSAE